MSDIHFHHQGWDDDLDQRRELVRDVAQLVRESGPVNAILVGGDIAFSADPVQYQKALEWIEQLMDVGGALELGDVWMVPGNHDINRSTVSNSPVALDFRQTLLECSLVDVDYILNQRMAEDPARDSLMLPLSEYNDFATSFGCATSAEAPSWFDDSLTVGALPVRLTGINSALASYRDSEDEGKRNLVVGVHQCHLERREGLVHIAMLHHPPHWLRDWENISPYLNRAHILLFGHEHAFAARQQVKGGTVEVSAGAVAPERRLGGEEEPYVACYNLISVDHDGGSSIDVEVVPRYWSKARTRYVDHPSGTQRFSVDLEPALDEPISSPIERDHEQRQEEAASPAAPLADLPRSSDEAALLAPGDRLNVRRIGVRFLNLAVTRRRQIARDLGVLTDDDLAMPAHELWPTVLTRVRDRGLIESLAKAIR